MQAPTVGDIILAARHVMLAPPLKRETRCENLFECVEEAFIFRTLTGKAHAFYGDGTLGSYALRHALAATPARLDREFLDTLMLVLTKLQHAAYSCS